MVCNINISAICNQKNAQSFAENAHCDLSEQRPLIYGYCRCINAWYEQSISNNLTMGTYVPVYNSNKLYVQWGGRYLNPD